MVLKINCIHNKDNAWCTNKNIKKSFWGLGARCCVEHQDKFCELKQKKQNKFYELKQKKQRNEFKVKKTHQYLSDSLKRISELEETIDNTISVFQIIHKIDNNTINKCRNSKSDAEFRRYLKELFENYNK